MPGVGCVGRAGGRTREVGQRAGRWAVGPATSRGGLPATFCTRRYLRPAALGGSSLPATSLGARAAHAQRKRRPSPAPRRTFGSARRGATRTGASVFAEGGLKACVPTWEAVSGLPACFGRRLVGSIGAAHHMNGRPMVFCEAKRGDGGHQPTKRRALFVDCCRKPARQRAVLQQDQERCRHAERRGIQLLIQQLDREYIFWERHAPWRAGRFPVKHIQSSGGRGGWREGHPRLHRLSTNNVPFRE